MSSLGVQDVDFGEHGVIYITSDKERQLLTEWTNPATEELLRVLPKQYTLYNEGNLNSKKKLYDNCAAHLNRKGYSYTTAQVENKWKSLKRRYLTKYERRSYAKYTRTRPRQLYDEEIETVLKMERPQFKKDMEISSVNLNVPPGFGQSSEEKEFDEVEDEHDEDLHEYEESRDHDYTQNDEKLVEMVLKDSHTLEEDNKSNVFAGGIGYLFQNVGDENSQQSSQADYTVRPLSQHSKDTDRLVREVKDLKRVIKRSLDTNSDILKTQNATHEQLLICLDTIEKREEEKMDIKRKKLEKQGELVQQVKIQNSLIAKLIQKLGNNGAK